MKICCCSYSMADRPSSSKDKLLTWFQDHKDTKTQHPGCLAIAAMPDALLMPCTGAGRMQLFKSSSLLVTPVHPEHQPYPPNTSDAHCSPREIISGPHSPDVAGILAWDMNFIPTTTAWPQMAFATCSRCIWAALRGALAWLSLVLGHCCRPGQALPSSKPRKG